MISSMNAMVTPIVIRHPVVTHGARTPVPPPGAPTPAGGTRLAAATAGSAGPCGGGTQAGGSHIQAGDGHIQARGGRTQARGGRTQARGGRTWLRRSPRGNAGQHRDAGGREAVVTARAEDDTPTHRRAGSSGSLSACPPSRGPLAGGDVDVGRGTPPRPLPRRPRHGQAGRTQRHDPEHDRGQDVQEPGRDHDVAIPSPARAGAMRTGAGTGAGPASRRAPAARAAARNWGRCPRRS